MLCHLPLDWVWGSVSSAPWLIPQTQHSAWFSKHLNKDSKKIQLVHPKGNQSWIFFGRTDVEAETLILWPPDVKSWLIGKDPDAGKGWGEEEKGTTEDEMVGWHHWLNGHEFEQAPGVGDGQGGLACCSPWGHKGHNRVTELNWTEWLRPTSHYSYEGECADRSLSN